MPTPTGSLLDPAVSDSCSSPGTRLAHGAPTDVGSFMPPGDGTGACELRTTHKPSPAWPVEGRAPWIPMLKRRVRQGPKRAGPRTNRSNTRKRTKRILQSSSASSGPGSSHPNSRIIEVREMPHLASRVLRLSAIPSQWSWPRANREDRGSSRGQLPVVLLIRGQPQMPLTADVATCRATDEPLQGKWSCRRTQPVLECHCDA
jgi:hypothetical protein